MENENKGHMLVCPACGNTEWKVVYKIGQWDIGECSVCHFARIDPLPVRTKRPEFYSEEKVIERNVKKLSTSQQISRSMKRFFKKVTKRDKNKIFYNKFSCYLPASSKILDIGCGDGSFLKVAKKRFSCSGIEISEYLASLARIDESLNIMTGDFLNIDFLDKKFDGITLISLLEHLDDAEAAIRKCFDILNAGGALLLKTVNYGCLNRVIKNGKWAGFRPPDHIIYFKPENLKMLLKKVGFKKIKISAWPFNDNMYCDARK